MFFAWAFFGLALVPVLGFADVGFLQFSLVADHYQRIALIAVVALLAAGIVRWRSRSHEPAAIRIRRPARCSCVVLGRACSAASSLFGDPIDFYTASIPINPQNWRLRVSLSAASITPAEYEDADQAIPARSSA